MKRLIIDIGNTLTKTAILNDGEIIFSDRTEKMETDFPERLFSEHPDIKSSVISAVKKYPSEIDDFLMSKTFFVKLDHNTKLPFTNKYKTPETLGKDRIALAAGAIKKFPHNNVLVIDAGTTITYDFVNTEKEYLGGGISPGIKMRFKALNNFTGKLPLISDENYVDLIGFNTKTSIQSGVLNGVLKETDGIIDEYKKRFSNLKVLISGGDYIFFVKKLKNSIFAAPNLVLEGLNEILIFNEDI